MSVRPAIGPSHWRDAGGRHTGQRDRVVEALEHVNRPASAQELFVSLRGQSGQRVSLATVYRTLKSLSEAGLVDTIRLQNNELAYMICKRGHHHHLTCRDCGKVVEVRDCRLDEWADSVAGEHGFAAVEHQAELVGVCSHCRPSDR